MAIQSFSGMDMAETINLGSYCSLTSHSPKATLARGKDLGRIVKEDKDLDKIVRAGSIGVISRSTLT